MSGPEADLFGDEQVFDVAKGDKTTLDELIERLLDFRAANPGSGGMLVEKYLAGARWHAGKVELAHAKVVRMETAGRVVAIPQFWSPQYDEPGLKGPACVRIS